MRKTGRRLDLASGRGGELLIKTSAQIDVVPDPPFFPTPHVPTRKETDVTSLRWL